VSAARTGAPGDLRERQEVPSRLQLLTGSESVTEEVAGFLLVQRRPEQLHEEGLLTGKPGSRKARVLPVQNGACGASEHPPCALTQESATRHGIGLLNDACLN